MLSYIIRRILYVIPVIFGVALVTFILFHVAGGNAPAIMLGKHASPEEIEALAKELGLWGPQFLNWKAFVETKSILRLFDSQLFHYFGQILTFDFGRSWSTNQRISTLIRDGILPSLSLTVPIFATGLVVAIAISLIAAFYRHHQSGRGRLPVDFSDAPSQLRFVPAVVKEFQTARFSIPEHEIL